MENKRFRFQIWAVVLLAVAMLPTLFWVTFPPANDILRIDSVSPNVDLFMSITQMFMLFSLVLFDKTSAPKVSFSGWIISSIGCCVLYYIYWVFYYQGFANFAVILGLTVPPCLAFCFFAIDRRNWFGLGLAVVFATLHLTHALLNYADLR